MGTDRPTDRHTHSETDGDPVKGPVEIGVESQLPTSNDNPGELSARQTSLPHHSEGTPPRSPFIERLRNLGKRLRTRSRRKQGKYRVKEDDCCKYVNNNIMGGIIFFNKAALLNNVDCTQVRDTYT